MRTVLPWLVYAALFYVMMRYGCGSHMLHGHADHGRGGHGGNASPADSGRDPVCGMPVMSGKGYTKSQEGRELRFCSKQCLDKFEAEPRRYVS
jgi:YHS domain-containing protein